MKKILLSTVALVGFTAGAMAADLPARRVAPIAPIVPVPVFTWTGFYVGVNAGYGWADDQSSDTRLPLGSVINSPTTDGTLTINQDRENEGFVGGGQIGYNYQIGTFVVGLEADIQYADLNRNDDRFATGTYAFTGFTGIAFAPPAPTVVDNSSSIDWFGTVRGRLGFAFDRALIYATGGFAYGGADDNNGFFNDFEDDEVRIGWTVGGGLEYAFTNNLSAKVEGLYVNLTRDDNAARAAFDPATNTVFVNNGRDNEFAVVRAGLNFKFNSF